MFLINASISFNCTWCFDTLVWAFVVVWTETVQIKACVTRDGVAQFVRVAFDEVCEAHDDQA